MHRFICRIILIVVITGLFACENSTNSDKTENTSLIFGDFYGYCIGEQCVDIYKLENRNLWEDTTDINPLVKPNAGRKFKKLPHELYQETKDLIELLPKRLINESAHIFGNPDSRDQGGLYIKYTDKETENYWIIDQDRGNIPEWLHDFHRSVNDKIMIIDGNK